MPIYEYRCSLDHCREEFELLVPLRKHRRRVGCPACGGYTADYILSIPHASNWSSDWKFPNLAHEGDGNMQFESKDAYEKYLNSEGIVESGAPRGNGKPSSYSKSVYGPSATAPISRMRGTW